MKLRDLVTLRRDLLFQGAVQIGWYETDAERAQKAAENFIFHGPKYHGVREKDFGSGQSYRLKDTLSFTLDILQQLAADGANKESLMLAAAGYGTGKSHLGLTLAVLLSGEFEASRQKILENIKKADEELGWHIEFLVRQQPGPYLIVAINGMQDFDLGEEIRRQILTQLRKRGLPTEVLEQLRPRFKTAKQFTVSFFDPLRQEFASQFGENVTREEIVAHLEAQDEATFRLVNIIYEEKMGQSIVAAGRESLQDFLGAFAREYCGSGKAFQGLLIIFDEFGRYLEFAVQRPHIAGAEGLQQLFEGVQDNAQSILLLCFIQSELRAYVSRVAPELRSRLERFVTRYDTAPKVRLSTNLETIIAHLLQKRDLSHVLKILEKAGGSEPPSVLMNKMRRWFPEMRHHALWVDPIRFAKVIREGCWPLHPATTWLLYSLTAVGKSFQQRSALSFLDDVFRDHADRLLEDFYWSIPPAALCTEAMVAEFKASEAYGDSAAVAHAFEEAWSRLQNELTEREENTLKAVLLAAKTGLCVLSEKDFIEAASVLAGESSNLVEQALEQLVKEYGALEWNEGLRRYDIVGDAVPRRVFLRHLADRANGIHSEQRASLFRERLGAWTSIERIETDYGNNKKINTSEWHFAVTFTDVASLARDVGRALETWSESFSVDQCRGQVLLCYVGPESDIGKVRQDVHRTLADAVKGLEGISHLGAPVAVVLVNDEDGGLGRDIAEYWVLEEESDQESFARFKAFVPHHKESRLERIDKRIREILERIPREDLILGCSTEITGGRGKEVFHKIFDAVYPEVIPFPFDGFHTARGNAAKDCIQFTRELFLGNLNQTTIAAYGAQQRNRAGMVLGKAWNIFLPDGNVSRRPGNPRVALVVDKFENSLQREGSLNLGQAVRILCRPPFGCNLASATLLLGVFAAPRRNEIHLYYCGETKIPEEWLGLAIQGNFFKLNVLDETEIRRDEGKSEFWKNFFHNWERETTYVGRVALFEQALILAKERPVPPALRDRWELCKRDAEEAIKRLKQYEETLKKQRGYAEKAYERGDSGNLARCACEFLSLLAQMKSDGSVWTEEQFEIIQQELTSCKVGAVHYFESWLPEQAEIDLMKFSAFQSRMTKTAENFEKLRLEKQAQRIRDHLSKLAEHIDILNKLKAILEEVNTFLAGTRIGPSSKVEEIRSILRRIDGLERKIQEAFKARVSSVLPLNEAWDKLQDLKKSCEVQLKAHQERAAAIWNRNLDSIDDVRETNQEVRTLITLYDGLEADLEDFRLMHRVLNLMEEHYQHMNSLTISETELDQRYIEAVNKVRSELAEDDEIPWPIEGTLRNLKAKIEKERREKAEKWMNQNVPELRQLQSMPADGILQIKRLLGSPPLCLTQQQLDQVRLILKACDRRLDELAVDGLVAKFTELSPDAQKEFLRRVLDIAEITAQRKSRSG